MVHAKHFAGGTGYPNCLIIQKWPFWPFTVLITNGCFSLMVVEFLVLVTCGITSLVICLISYNRH